MEAKKLGKKTKQTHLWITFDVAQPPPAVSLSSSSAAKEQNSLYIFCTRENNRKTVRNVFAGNKSRES
jgi:hypothetical protein